MPGTLLLADLERNNASELSEHLESLLSAPGGGYDPSSLGQPNVTVQPPQQAQDELQAHLDSLLVPNADQPAPVASTPAPAPAAPPPTPAPAAPSNVVDELANHVRDVTGGGLNLLGEGLTSLRQGGQAGLQSLGQGVSSLRPAPAPPAAPVSGSPPGGLNQAAGGALDASSHGSFVSSLQPHAEKWSRITGIPASYLLAWAASESNWGKAGNALFGIKQSSQPGTAPGLRSATWEQGQGATVDTFANYNTPDEAFASLDQFLQGRRYQPIYEQLRSGKITPDQFMRGINAAGYATDPDWGAKIGQIAQRSISPLMGEQRVTRPPSDLGYRDVSQFGDAQLTAAEAAAACGPATAVRFAQRFGRNPTLREATDLASTVGWAEGQGMAGLGSEQKLLEKMGVSTRMLSGARWDEFAREAQTGNPVVISTPGHYFYADNYDSGSGRYHVGRSGLDLRGGKEWMTPDEMTSLMGGVQGGLLADSPAVPTFSTASSTGFTAPAPIEQGLRFLGEGISRLRGEGGEQQAASVGEPKSLQSLDQAVDASSRPAAVPGMGYDPSNIRAAEPPAEGVPLKQDLNQPLQPTVFDQAGQFLQEGGTAKPIADATQQIAPAFAEQFGPALGEAREQIANAPVLGGALGMVKGPLFISDQEYLQRATPDERESAAEMIRVLERDPDYQPSDAEIAKQLRTVDVGQSFGMAHVGPGGARAGAPQAAPPRGAIDYEALAQLRRDARAAQPGLPDMPSANESRLNREIAASVNNMFAIPSMVTNAIGGGIETVKRPVVTAFTGDLGAAGADLRAMGLGLGDAFADMGTTFRTGIRPSRAPSSEVVGQAAYEGQDVLKSGAARIGFLRAMEATDEFMRSLNSAGAQASEIARLMKAHPDLSQEQILSRFGANLLDAGEKAAADSVYSVGGTGIGRQMSQWRSLLTASDATPAQRAAGLVTNVLVPFSNIPDVILTKGLQRLPIVPNGLTMVRQLRSADPRVRQRAITSAALAEAVNVGIWTQVQEGNITGNGPSDPAKKAALQNARDANGEPIWQPNSVRIGGRWLPYASLGPVGLRMGVIANVTEQINDEMSKPNPSQAVIDRAQSVALAALDGTSETVADAWYLQTVGRLFNAMKNGGVGPALGQTALSTAQRAIPYGGELRSIEGAVDPTVAEPRNPLEAIAAGIPFASQLATPKIDPTTGRPLERPADVGTLLTRSPGSGEPTPVDTALATHNMGVPDAPQTITQRNFTVSITPDEQRQYTIEAGQRVEKNVQALLDNPRWSSQTPEQQKQALQQAVGAARADAAALVWRSIPPKDLDDRVRATRARQAQEAEPVFRTPVTTP